MYSGKTVDLLKIHVDGICEHFFNFAAVQGGFIGIFENAEIRGFGLQKSDCLAD